MIVYKDDLRSKGEGIPLNVVSEYVTKYMIITKIY
jgi:hypothetical protein